jgi:hypothetical protein
VPEDQTKDWPDNVIPPRVEGGHGGEASAGIGKLTAQARRAVHLEEVLVARVSDWPIVIINSSHLSGLFGFSGNRKDQVIEVIRRWDRMVAPMVWK